MINKLRNRFAKVGKSEEGGALLIVLVLLGIISMLTGMISIFTKSDEYKKSGIILSGRMLTDDIRNPMRLEINEMWHKQLLADDEWCSELNFLNQVSGMTQDGPAVGQMQFIGTLDSLFFNIDSKLKTYMSKWENTWRKALNIKVIQTGPAVEPSGSPRKRIPIAFVTEWRWKTKEEAKAFLDDLASNGQVYWFSKWIDNPSPGHWEPTILTMDNWPYNFDLISTKRYQSPIYPMILEVDTGFTPIACYGEVSSRNICMDWGGIFNPDPPSGTKKCDLP